MTLLRAEQPPIIQLMDAIRSGNHAEVAHIIHTNKMTLNINQLVAGMTPLMWAAADGHSNIVRLLLANGAKINNLFSRLPSAINYTPLLFAAEHNHTDTVETLLKRHARVNDCDQKDQSALVFAALNRNKDMVKIILRYEPEINTGQWRFKLDAEARQLILECLQEIPTLKIKATIDSYKDLEIPSEDKFQAGM